MHGMTHIKTIFFCSNNTFSINHAVKFKQQPSRLKVKAHWQEQCGPLRQPFCYDWDNYQIQEHIFAVNKLEFQNL